MRNTTIRRFFAASILAGLMGCAAGEQTAQQTAREPSAEPEVRGTWITTTANTHIATPENTAQTMATLRDMGLNTVYVESWKNGYTQYPSAVLEKIIGVDRRPVLAKQDPGDPDGANPPRDLLGEMVIEAHRNGMLCIAWFEYGFMAAHKDTQNHLREMYPEWLSRDIDGNEVAPNGFVWMNPLHPKTRRFLLDLVLEAVDKYDLDGVQLDDRIVWPYKTMGYDEYTQRAYARDHNGQRPPADHDDPEWRRWRAEKINSYAKQFVRELREKRPGLIVSLSPAPYPWSWENYLLEWPQWATWEPGNSENTWWDEFIPQCYRYDFPAFKATWDQQVNNLAEARVPERVSDMLAGVLTTGSRPDPVPWSDLEPAIEHVRDTGGGGHVWWFSRGVLDVYPQEITAMYDVENAGHAPHPKRPADWRPVSTRATKNADGDWISEPADFRHARLIVKRDGVWNVEYEFEFTDDRHAVFTGRAEGTSERSATRLGELWDADPTASTTAHTLEDLNGTITLELAKSDDPTKASLRIIDVTTADGKPSIEGVELLVDRRPEMASVLVDE